MANEIYNVKIMDAQVTFKGMGMGKQYVEIYCRASKNQDLLDAIGANLEIAQPEEENKEGYYAFWLDDDTHAEIYIGGL
jgi:hypothetical protein